MEEGAILIDAEVSYVEIGDVIQGYENDQLFGQIAKALNGDWPIGAQEKV